jgi:hypothetical protein
VNALSQDGVTHHDPANFAEARLTFGMQAFDRQTKF